MNQTWACPICKTGSRHSGYCSQCMRSRPARYVAMQPAQQLGALPMRSIAADITPRLTIPGFPSIESAMNGGFVCGSTTLCYGGAGLGKTRLAMLLADRMSRLGPSLYVSTEQTEEQLKLTAMLMGIEDSLMLVGYRTTIGEIADLARGVKPAPRFMVIDSIQEIVTEEASVVPRGRKLVTLARNLGCALLIMSHETKDGDYAAPRTLEHTVDAMVWLWKHHDWIVWEVANKYRYGPVGAAALLADMEGRLYDGGQVTTGRLLRSERRGDGAHDPGRSADSGGSAGTEEARSSEAGDGGGAAPGTVGGSPGTQGVA